MTRRASAIAAASVLLTLTGLSPLCAEAGAADAGDGKPPLGLMGTLPIYWGEAEGLDDLLFADGQGHWARQQLEQDYRLFPLDWLDAPALHALQRLMLAQPRALSPEENVALDDWVRDGGQLLLFADPMLTGESRFALGDRRRRQDVVLLSPILDHWGLRLEYAEDQPPERRHLDVAGGAVPVQLAGRLAPSGTGRDCTIGASGLVAQCRIGAGTAVIVADAALLDMHRPDPSAGGALSLLLARAFPKIGDGAGNRRTESKNTVFQKDSKMAESRAPPGRTAEKR